MLFFQLTFLGLSSNSSSTDSEARCEPMVPLLGNLPNLLKSIDRHVEFAHEHSQKLDFKPYQVSLPFRAAVVHFSSPDILEHVLKTHFDNYIKGPLFFNLLNDLLGYGIFTVDGEAWKPQRKIASNIFTVSKFKTYVNHVFHSEMKEFISILDEQADKKTNLDLHDYFHRYTLDAFALIAFGAHINCLKANTAPEFAKAFDRAQVVTSTRFMNPFHKFLETFLPVGTQFRHDVRTLRSYCRQIVQERRLHSSETQDLLSLFMNANSEEMDMNDEFLVDSLLNFIIAGRDTTAQALSWAFFHLSKHPHVVQRAREELDKVLKDESFPEYDQLKELEYTKAIFLETLRLNPSVPMNVRTCVTDDVWPDGTKIPAGSFVQWSSYDIHRNPHVWGKDCNEFNPDRWLQMTTQPSQFKFSSFHGGPRVCLGRNMAELEGTFVLACLLKRFNVRVVHPEQVVRAFSLTSPMRHGLLVELEKRIK